MVESIATVECMATAKVEQNGGSKKIDQRRAAVRRLTSDGRRAWGLGLGLRVQDVGLEGFRV